MFFGTIYLFDWELGKLRFGSWKRRSGWIQWCEFYFIWDSTAADGDFRRGKNGRSMVRITLTCEMFWTCILISKFTWLGLYGFKPKHNYYSHPYKTSEPSFWNQPNQKYTMGLLHGPCVHFSYHTSMDQYTSLLVHLFFFVFFLLVF